MGSRLVRETRSELVNQIGEKVEWKKMGFIGVGEGTSDDEGESQQHRGEVCIGKGESDDGGCV